MATPGYNWIAHYQSALFELHPENIRGQISKAEEVIQKRRLELLELSQTGDELSAIERALKALSQLREIDERHT